MVPQPATPNPNEAIGCHQLAESTMGNVIRVASIPITVTRKHIKHVHLSVHPPAGRVTMSVPAATRLAAARAYASTKLGWIRQQQQQLRGQARETRREFIGRESHYLWGRRHLLTVVEQNAKPAVAVDHRRITLRVRPGSTQATRAAVIHNWHKALLHEFIPELIAKWQPRLGVQVTAYFLQRMKTKWGSCNHQAGHIRLNTELVKKPRDLIEYIVVHEMLHLLEPTHSERFVTLLSQHLPRWQEARAKLNELPLPAVHS